MNMSHTHKIVTLGLGEYLYYSNILLESILLEIIYNSRFASHVKVIIARCS